MRRVGLLFGVFVLFCSTVMQAEKREFDRATWPFIVFLLGTGLGALSSKKARAGVALLFKHPEIFFASFRSADDSVTPVPAMIGITSLTGAALLACWAAMHKKNGEGSANNKKVNELILVVSDVSTGVQSAVPCVPAGCDARVGLQSPRNEHEQLSLGRVIDVSITAEKVTLPVRAQDLAISNHLSVEHIAPEEARRIFAAEMGAGDCDETEDGAVTVDTSSSVSGGAGSGNGEAPIPQVDAELKKIKKMMAVDLLARGEAYLEFLRSKRVDATVREIPRLTPQDFQSIAATQRQVSSQRQVLSQRQVSSKCSAGVECAHVGEFMKKVKQSIEKACLKFEVSSPAVSGGSRVFRNGFGQLCDYLEAVQTRLNQIVEAPKK